MSRRLELLERLEKALENPATESERRRLRMMIEELMRMESEASDSWQGEVDRQSGAFTDQEILDSKTWK